MTIRHGDVLSTPRMQTRFAQITDQYSFPLERNRDGVKKSVHYFESQV